MSVFLGVVVFIACCVVAIGIVGEGATFSDKVADLIFRVKTFKGEVDQKVKDKESKYYHPGKDSSPTHKG
jgi:hypothetical protein